LHQVAAVFDDPVIGFMGGRILLYDPSDARLTIREDEQVEVVPPMTFIPAGRIQGANMAFRRILFDDLGGFDERFGPGAYFSGGDAEFVARASFEGWTGGYFPGPVVYHHHRRKPGVEAARQMAKYDWGRGAFYAKFALRPDTRRVFLRQWWWRTRSQSRSAVLRELGGAAKYLWASLASR
jgi:hypothetical protein